MLMSIRLSLEISEFDVMLIIRISMIVSFSDSITSQSLDVRNEKLSSTVDTR